MRKIVSLPFLLSAMSFSLFTFSCKSVDYSVNQTWEEENFFVAAQDASDNGNYEQALFYYQVYMTRYPDNYRKVLAAQYEIGFIYFKKGQYKLSRRVLESVLEQYANSPYVVFLEDRYRILSEIIIKSIDDNTAKKAKKKSS